MPKDQRPTQLPEGPPLDRRVSYRISRLNARLNAQAARILSESAKISLSQWRVLVMIEREGAITASEIVRRTKIDKALISRTIKGLVGQGLIEVDIQASDQRSHLLRFSPKGLRCFKEAWPHMLARHNSLIATISDKELDAFFATLTKIESAIASMDPGR